MFDPIKFPMAKSLFFNEAATEAASSGILVPIATIVILIILSDTLNLFATDIDDFIKVSAPTIKLLHLLLVKMMLKPSVFLEINNYQEKMYQVFDNRRDKIILGV